MTAPRLRLGVCVVSYKERFSSTSAFASLSRLPTSLLQHLVVVSVCNSASPDMEIGVQRQSKEDGLAYSEIARDDNPGLAGGYNSGLQVLLDADVNAVLFLNADADVTAPYVQWLIESLQDRSTTAGFAPTLTSRNRQVSPFRKRGLSMPFFIIGYLCLRTGPFLRDLKFPPEFWLDGIDYWLSARLAEQGLEIELAPFFINHNLSVSDQFDTLPAWRYRNILISERAFLKRQQRPFIDVCVVYARAYLRCLRYRRLDLAGVVMREFMIAAHER